MNFKLAIRLRDRFERALAILGLDDKHWGRWTLPSKYSALGLFVGLMGVVVTVGFYAFPKAPKDTKAGISLALETAYKTCVASVDDLQNVPDSLFKSLMIPPPEMLAPESASFGVLDSETIAASRLFYNRVMLGQLQLLQTAITDLDLSGTRSQVRRRYGAELPSAYETSLEVITNMYPNKDFGSAATEGVTDLSKRVGIRKELFLDSYRAYCKKVGGLR